MKLFVAFLLTFIAFADASGGRVNRAIRRRMSESRRAGGGRIVGGQAAEAGQFPFQVSIREFIDVPLSHICGGSLVSDTYVLTAGHCCEGAFAFLFHAVAGDTHSLLPEGTEEHRAVKKIIQHEAFDMNSIVNDICLLELSEPFELNEFVNVIELPEQMQPTNASTVCTVTGFGTKSEGNPFLPETLQWVEVPVVGDEECNEAYGSMGATVYDSMICAGVPEGGKDSCQGDSGGPMFDSETGEQLGIVSWGYGCARPGYPGVYTEVAYFIDWMYSHMA